MLRREHAIFVAFAFWTAISTGYATYELATALLGEGWAIPIAALAFTVVIRWIAVNWRGTNSP